MNKIIKLLREFNSRRDWGQFHSPKNLVMALSVEVSELAEKMQWLSQSESFKFSPYEIKDEIADVMIYALILADKFSIDPQQAIIEKIAINDQRYPVLKAKGSNKKYTEF
jgi:NTP pyrophosphatase (non-canonical NTP hydrolase)